MFVHLTRRIALVCASVAALSGCGGGHSLPPSGAIPGPALYRSQTRFAVPDVTQKIYVASRESNAILVYAVTADGDAAPVRVISGSLTLLGAPISLAFSPNGHLDVVNDGGNNVLIFPKGSNGNVAPQILGGTHTHLATSEGVAIDAAGKIYVSDFRNNVIHVFASGATGDVAPIRTISGAKTKLDSPCGMAFDSAGHLYVANYLSAASPILEFSKTANGNVAPIATLGGSHTGLGAVFNVNLDSGDRIVAGNNTATSVRVFAAGAHGNVAPVATISGSKTKFTYITSTGVDSNGLIYVANAKVTSGVDKILVFAKNANGNVAPLANITGSNTQLDEPFSPTVH
jgi:hypothetical protein